MSYESPFRLIDDDHDSIDPLCLSRTHHADPDTATWEECYEAALALCDIEAPQFAFWAARQLVELGLKRLIGSGYPTTHDLVVLIAHAPDITDGTIESERICRFALDLNRIDTRGDGGRYPTDRRGQPALGTVCCIERDVLRDLVRATHDYVDARVLSADYA